MSIGARWLSLACSFWVLWLASPVSADDRPLFTLPLVCKPHKTCFIQNYVDIDPGQGSHDYSCGVATYNGHSGVDFRVLSAEVTKLPVPVLASAEGTVKAIRDGVDDAIFKKSDAKDVTGRECGNGVILDHSSGWETQYCHMRKGSIRVEKGQAVKRGDRLGDVGYSGMADFAQVHLTVRHNDKIVDLFSPDSVDGACVKNPKGPGLWEPAVAAAFPYRNGELLTVAFAGAPPRASALEIDHRDVTPLSTKSDVLVLYGRFINLLKGDRVHFGASGPEGQIFDETAAALKQNMATYVAFTGKRRGDRPSWPAGRYDGRVQLVRDGGVIATTLTSFDLE